MPGEGRVEQAAGDGAVPAAAQAPTSCRACTGLFLLALIPALYYGAALLLPIVLAVLFNLLLSPAVRALRRVGVPGGLGALLVLALVVAAIGITAWRLSVPAAEWMERAPSVARELREKLRPLQDSMRQMQKATEEVEKAADVAEPKPVQHVKVTGPTLMERLMDRAQDVIVGAFVMLVLLYFLMASDDFFLRKVVRIIPQLRNKIRAVEIGRAIEMEIGRYFAAFALLNIVYGALVAVVLYFLGMPNPALWGAVVGVLNFVPYLGPVISLTLITLVSLLTFDTLGHALLAPAVYATMDAIEGNVVEPLLFGRSVSLNPVAIFVSLLFWGTLWGAAGIVLAVPILIVAKVACQHIDSLQGVAEFLDRR